MASPDLLRVLVVVGLVFFHASLVFDARDDFYVKNADTTELTFYVAGLAVLWAMHQAVAVVARLAVRRTARR